MASPILASFTNAERGRYDTASVLTGVFRTRKGQSVAAVVLAETLLAEEITLTIAAKIAALNAFDALEVSIDRPPTELITAAFAAASHAVQHHKSLTGRNALCSMAIALVYGGKTLYIGSIGLTRIYLLRRESGLVQLTMDHTVGNLAIQRGESPARARQRPDFDLVGYALGMDAESTPDIGIYDVSSNAVEAEQRGREGIPVHGRDAVLICTQTVYGISPSGVPFVSNAEIAEVLSKSTGMRTAEILIDIAIDRKPPTTVSVGTMHMRGGSILNPRAHPTLFGIVLLAIVIGLIVLIFANRGSAPEVIRATETRTQALVTATSTPTTIAVTAITPSAVSTIALLPATTEPTNTLTPTASPSITPTPSETAEAVLSSEMIQILDWDTTGVRSTVLTRALDPVTTFDLMIREIRFESASIFLMPNSFVDLHTVSDQAITAAFAQTSSLLVIADANTPVVSMEYMNLRPSVFSIADGCVSLHMISAEMLVASCFAGTCTLSRGFAEQPDVIIPEGQQVIYLPSSAALSSFAPIEPLEVRHYFELLTLAESAQACLAPYLHSDLTATPTLTSTAIPSSTATRTAAPPTRTRVPSTSTARPSATASASSTSSPTSTFTVTITATSTPTTTASATMTLTTSASATPSPTPSATETETATFTATATPTFDAVFPTNTPISTETPTPTPTLYLSPTPNTAISP